MKLLRVVSYRNKIESSIDEQEGVGASDQTGAGGEEMSKARPEPPGAGGSPNFQMSLDAHPDTPTAEAKAPGWVDRCLRWPAVVYVSK